MSQNIRKEVLKAFKRLHRTREYVFCGDQRMLAAARNEINTKFRKNFKITDENEIKKLVQLADDVEKELRTTVVQAEEKDAGVYKLNIRKEIPRLDNFPFNPDAVIEKPRRSAARCGSAGKTDK